MSGMDQTNDRPGEYYTTEAPWDTYSTTAEEYATSTNEVEWGTTRATTATTEHYPGESTTTAHQWSPFVTETSTSAQPTTATASTSQSSTTSTTTSSASSKSNSSNNTKTIAIAVPVAVVGAAIIAALLFFIFRRRRQRNQHHNQPIPQTDMMAVTVPRDIQPPPNRSSTWEFAPTNSHDIPFSGPIPGRPITTTTPTTTDQPRNLDPTSSTHTNTLPTEDPLQQEQHLAPTDSRPVITPTIPAWPDQTQPQPQNRPTSPFDHPLDDAVSEISRRSRDLDDISSVSSFGEDDDDERRPAMHRA
ncbi:hypothetical protein BO94DRAFT_571899 [Aspergillus sclerotioniger CBS 115572]|uniref:Mid2 domain-containing protein n=1 Tax=Aspergillus sclerotioniger CBS 115572 TaxID=1450535 RepID=A0A317X9T8_9EURO|nr:hypothetical protein BO94DRAFT_571899 [Aspergillus sclerotioniger CBS 115572]PWY95304.1 hypothetical protein BO94DRAFT_571899 [Aspergillus sclerotioniger CBS 115572]